MLRTRHPASDALLDLREALGQTQPEFAKTMGVSRGSIARWETRHPPQGETLIRLAEEALKARSARRASLGKQATRDAQTQKLIDLVDTFKKLYLDEVFANLGGFDQILLRFHATKADEQTVYLLAKLHGRDKIRAAYKLMDSPDTLFEHHERLYGPKTEGKD